MGRNCGLRSALALPHLYRVVDRDIEVIACAASSEGPGFTSEVVDQADRMEIWASSCTADAQGRFGVSYIAFP